MRDSTALSGIHVEEEHSKEQRDGKSNSTARTSVMGGGASSCSRLHSGIPSQGYIHTGDTAARAYPAVWPPHTDTTASTAASGEAERQQQQQPSRSRRKASTAAGAEALAGRQAGRQAGGRAHQTAGAARASACSCPCCAAAASGTSLHAAPTSTPQSWLPAAERRTAACRQRRWAAPQGAERQAGRQAVSRAQSRAGNSGGDLCCSRRSVHLH